MMEFLVLTDEKGGQYLCLEDGTVIPSQVFTIVTQEGYESAQNGTCIATVKFYINSSFSKGQGWVSIEPDMSGFIMPDGRKFKPFSFSTELGEGGEVMSATIVVNAKLCPTKQPPIKKF